MTRQRHSSQQRLHEVNGSCLADLGFVPDVAVKENGAQAVRCTRIASREAVQTKETAAAASSIVFAGCAKNVASTLRRSVAFIEGLAAEANVTAAFGSYRILVFESGSSDATRATLRAMAARNPRLSAILAESPRYGLCMRTQKIALCRNVLLQEALARGGSDVGSGGSGGRGAPSVMVTLDIDCNHEVPRVLPGMQRALRAIDKYAVLSANTRPFYYDLWALRASQLLVDYDCLIGDQCAVGNCTARYGIGGCTCKAGYAEVWRRGSCFDYDVTIDPSPLAPIVDITSGFAGLAVLNLQAIGTATPVCRFDGNLHSEHVPFQQCLRSRGLRVGLVPSLVSGCGAEAQRKLHMGLPPKKARINVTASGSIEYVHNESWAAAKELEAAAAARQAASVREAAAAARQKPRRGPEKLAPSWAPWDTGAGWYGCGACGARTTPAA